MELPYVACVPALNRSPIARDEEKRMHVISRLSLSAVLLLFISTSLSIHHTRPVDSSTDIT
jgi:hypothetical protein